MSYNIKITPKLFVWKFDYIMWIKKQKSKKAKKRNKETTLHTHLSEECEREKMTMRTASECKQTKTATRLEAMLLWLPRMQVKNCNRMQLRNLQSICTYMINICMYVTYPQTLVGAIVGRKIVYLLADN